MGSISDYGNKLENLTGGVMTLRTRIEKPMYMESQLNFPVRPPGLWKDANCLLLS
jgi:hypothetical protein